MWVRSNNRNGKEFPGLPSKYKQTSQEMWIKRVGDDVYFRWILGILYKYDADCSYQNTVTCTSKQQTYTLLIFCLS